MDKTNWDYQNVTDVWKHFRTDLTFLANLVPMLPNSLLWRAVGLATHMNISLDPLMYAELMDQTLYAFLLEALAARLPQQARQALLEEALTYHPDQVRYLPTHLLQDALTAIRSMESAELRPTLLAGLAMRFPSPQRDMLLQEALAGVSALMVFYRGRALVQMVSFFTKPLRKDLLQKILEIADSFGGAKAIIRTEVLTALIPVVPSSIKKQMQQEAINAIMGATDSLKYSEMLEKLFALLPPSLRQSLISGLLADIQKKEGSSKAFSLEDLLSVLSKPVKGETLTQIFAIVRGEVEDPPTYVHLTRMIVPLLPKSSKRVLLKQGLAIMRTIDEDQRKEVVTGLIPSFAEIITKKELLEVVALVYEIKDDEDRAEALVPLIPLVPESLKENLLQEVVTIVRTLEYGFGRFWVVNNLMRVLPAPLQGQVLQEVMFVTKQTDDESVQARNIQFIATYLPQDQPLLWQALTIALNMRNNRHRSRALDSLYRYFPKEHLSEALAKTVAVEDEVIRAWGLLEIGPQLTDNQLLQAALEAALAILGQYARALALAGLAFALEDREQPPREQMYQLLGALSEEQRYRVLEDMLRSFWIWYQLFIITAATEITPPEEPLPVPKWSGSFESLPPLRPVRERTISTGFSPYEQADVPLSMRMPLTCGQPYYFWLEVGPPVVESVENIPKPLPIEHLPPNGQLIVVIYPLDEELQLMGNDTGTLELQADGSVRVVTQPEHPVGLAPESDLLVRRLFFPIKAPPRPGKFSFDCHIYYQETLIQSRQVFVQVMTKPVLRPVGRANYSILDFSLSKTLDGAHLAANGSPRISMILKSKRDGTHHFLFLSKNGTEVVKGDAIFGEQQLANMMEDMRGALRYASWGNEQAWNGSKEEYRYAGPKNFQRMKDDLVLFAIRGYRFYRSIIDSLSSDSRRLEQLRKLMTESGLIQFALQRSASAVLPLSLVYDYPLQTNEDIKKYKLCGSFEKALADSEPLEASACFQGTCPSKGQDTVICPSGFWGYRHAIGMPLSVENEPEVVQKISYKDIIQIAVGVSTDPAFIERSAHEQALKLLRIEWNNTDIQDSGWHYADNRESVFKLLKQVRSHLVYFYCHGGVDEGIPYLRVGYKENPITPDNLYSDFPQRDQGPLVFINGCETGFREPGMALTFAQAFVYGQGAVGVIGTEVSVFEQLACTFAENCLRSFLKGLPIGEAIRRTRLMLLKQENPLGLIYVPFVKGGLCIVPAKLDR